MHLAALICQNTTSNGPLPDIPNRLGINSQTSFRNVIRWAREEKLIIRQLYERCADARGQRALIGSPEQLLVMWPNGFSRMVSTAFQSSQLIFQAVSTTLLIW
jgi:hypothetical protein